MLSLEEKERIMYRIGIEIQYYGHSNFKAYPVKLAHVYAFEMSNYTVKIGISNDVKKRMLSIESNSGLKIINRHQTEAGPRDFMFSVERRCKEMFSANCIQGEYFDIDFADACIELDKYAEGITVALRMADEKFLDEISYVEDLRLCWTKANQDIISPNVAADSSTVAEDTISLEKKIDAMLKCAELTNLDRLRNQILREVMLELTGKKF